MASQQLLRALGTMSGTSADGVDVALIETDGRQQVRFIGGCTRPYPGNLHDRLVHAAHTDVSLVELLRIENELTNEHVRAVNALINELSLSAHDVDVIGFHGHTLRHVPEEGLTLQAGNAALLAEQTGVTVVADFRRRDMAAGGQGAPLVPLYHQVLMDGQEKPLVVLNLGGVANVTWLGRGGGIQAGDTGPGCGLLDAWVRRRCGVPYDRDGTIAMTGKIDWEHAHRALAAPFFSRRFPKSADRFDFSFIDVSTLSAADGAATLCAVTTEAVWQAAQRLAEPPTVVWVSGGGARHPLIIKLLKQRFETVRDVAELNLRPDTLEAECFAWLAARRTLGLPLTTPDSTGCRHATCGGQITA